MDQLLRQQRPHVYFHLQLWGPWPRECTWMANLSASGGEGVPTRSNLSHFSIDLLETHSLIIAMNAAPFHLLIVNATQHLDQEHSWGM